MTQGYRSLGTGKFQLLHAGQHRKSDARSPVTQTTAAFLIGQEARGCSHHVGECGQTVFHVEIGQTYPIQDFCCVRRVACRPGKVCIPAAVDDTVRKAADRQGMPVPAYSGLAAADQVESEAPLSELIVRIRLPLCPHP